MPLTGVAEIERRVYARIAEAPEHSTRLRGLKQVVDRIVSRGHAKRVPMRGTESRVPLRVEITEAGRQHLAALNRR